MTLGSPRGFPSASSAIAKRFPPASRVSSTQTATSPRGVGTTSIHTMSSFVRATSTAGERGLPVAVTPVTESASPRSVRSVHATTYAG